jgi:hypothetical protein
MFISKEEAERRLSSGRNLASASFVSPRVSLLSSENPGPISTGPIAPEVTKSTAEVREIDRSFTKQKDLLGSKRTQIAKFAIENPKIKQSDVALLHNVSVPEVAACKSGKIGGRPANSLNKDIRSELLNSAKDTALEKLMVALGLLDAEKLASLESAKDIGRFSKDMASVYNSLTAQTQASGAQVNLIVYAPKSKNEDNFKIVDV